MVLILVFIVVVDLISGLRSCLVLVVVVVFGQVLVVVKVPF